MRQFRISGKAARLCTAASVALLALLTSLSIGFFVKESHRLRAQELEEEKRLLARDLGNLQRDVEGLRTTLDDLTDRDAHYRLLAGLDPIDEEVRQAGIGGPGTETLQNHDLWRLDPELGAATFTTAYDLNGMTRRARLLSTSWREATEQMESAHERWAHRPSIWPTRGYVSSGFSRQRMHPLLHRLRPHEGIDITAAPGTPIVAPARGRVTFAGRRGGYGLMTEIDHGNGLVTRYAHASRIVVRLGQVVERGEKIGEVGSTGLSIGPHLHYEVLQDGRPQNPMNYILEREVAP